MMGDMLDDVAFGLFACMPNGLVALHLIVFQVWGMVEAAALIETVQGVMVRSTS